MPWSSATRQWSASSCGGHPRRGEAVGLAAQLNAEWDDLREELTTWRDQPIQLAAVLESIRFNPDAVLTELVEASQAGHQLAGRLIVQALLPKLILFSRAFPHPSVDDLVAALWIRIARYPLARRPRALAANLVLDARKDVVAEQRVVTVRLLDDPETEEPDGAAVFAQFGGFGGHFFFCREYLF